MKTVLITGASRGIGAATARLCGARGWRVGVNYTANAQAAERVVVEIEAAGGAALAVQGDVSDEAAVAAMFDAVAARFGPVTGLVANAGVIDHRMPLAEMSAERIRRVVEVNVVGALLTLREGARRMSTARGGPGGAIVVTSSMAAALGSPNEFVDYAASKGATDAMTKGVAKELAREGVRVNAVRPGLIETEIHAAAGWPERAQAMADNVPMGRAGSAEETAEAIVWLLSDAASYVTATTLDVSGGR